MPSGSAHDESTKGDGLRADRIRTPRPSAPHHRRSAGAISDAEWKCAVRYLKMMPTRGPQTAPPKWASTKWQGFDEMAASTSGSSMSFALVACGCCGRRETQSKQFRYCGGCKKVNYCSSECQQRHWREGGHRKVCLRRDNYIAPAQLLPPLLLQREYSSSSSGVRVLWPSRGIYYGGDDTIAWAGRFHGPCRPQSRERFF